MNLTQIKYAIRKLPLSQLKKLNGWLRDLIREAELKSLAGQSARKQTIAERILDNKTYRLEKIRCGKENCRCNRGKLHGPYWYSYMRVKDKVTSQYVGKNLPREIEKNLDS